MGGEDGAPSPNIIYGSKTDDGDCVDDEPLGMSCFCKYGGAPEANSVPDTEFRFMRRQSFDLQNITFLKRRAFWISPSTLSAEGWLSLSG